MYQLQLSFGLMVSVFVRRSIIYVVCEASQKLSQQLTDKVSYRYVNKSNIFNIEKSK